MNKKNRLITLILILATGTLLLIFLAIWGVNNMLSLPRLRTFKFVKDNLPDLENIVEAYEKNEKELPKEFNDCKIEYVDEGDVPIIQFNTFAYGIVPSSTYYGFYYSPDDLPHAYWNYDAELIPDGENKWNYDMGGDDRGSTEKILPNWYFFKVSF